MGQPAPSALVPKASWQSCVFVLLWAVDGLSTDQASSALWKQKRSHAWASSLSLAGAVTVRLQDPSCCARCNFITTPGAAPLHQCEADWYHIKMKDPKHALLPGVFVKRIFKTPQTQVKFFNVKFLGDLKRTFDRNLIALEGSVIEAYPRG